jgi:hypothetical protein
MSIILCLSAGGHDKHLILTAPAEELKGLKTQTEQVRTERHFCLLKFFDRKCDPDICRYFVAFLGFPAPQYPGIRHRIR